MVDQSKRLANVLRERGLRPGDHVAIFMTNVPEYFEVVWAARRAGYFYTAISWHLTPGEVRYLLENSQSKALIVSADLADVAEQAIGDRPEPGLRLLIGPRRPGWDDYAATVAKAETAPLGPELEGQAMLYSSGTTGRPKGIVHTTIDAGRRFGDVAGDILWVNRYGLDPSTVTLNVGPLYHAAPLVSAMATHRHGGTVVLLPKFDAEQTLHAIEHYRVTYAQFVPTMFIRLLRLPEAVRRRYDVSSLRTVAHSAAPCPVEVKRQMIDWFGPVIYEYYSATEAAGHVSIGSQEWLEHPGSVGRVAPGSVAITDESGGNCRPAEDGTIWFTRPANKFSYHNDPEKSASMFNDRGWARMGDLGHLDERRVPVHHRPLRPHDHLRRRQHLPAGDRGPAHRAPRRRRRRGDRGPRRRVRRVGHGGRHRPRRLRRGLAGPRLSGTSSTGPGRASRTTSAPGRSRSSTPCRARWPAR